jgi:hypothetical protein
MGFLVDMQPRIFGVVVTVYSDDPCYAGTLDLWAEVKKGLFAGTWLWDWKSSKGVYGDYAIQLSAYRHAQRALVGGDDRAWGPDNAQRLGIVHIRPDGWTLHEVEALPLRRRAYPQAAR